MTPVKRRRLFFLIIGLTLAYDPSLGTYADSYFTLPE